MHLAIVSCLTFSLLGFAGSVHWFFDQFSHFRVQLFVALAALLFAVIAGRQWMFAGLALIGICANLTVLLPHSTGTSELKSWPADVPRFRCVSINLLQGNKRHDKLETFVRGSGADVIVFQEVSPRWGEALQGLTDIYPTQLIRARKDSKGAALLSKHPARRLEFEVMPGQKKIGAVVGEIEAKGGPVTVFGIHSPKPTSAEDAASQHAYFEWLARRTSDERAKGRHVVIMGDCNSTPWSNALRTFASENQLLNTSRGVVFGATWNVLLPYRLMIDHGFISPGLGLVSRQVGPEVGSDHRPLILDLALPDRG